MRYGYARVSTRKQDLEIQHRALTEAGCERIFEEKRSGSDSHREELAKLMRRLQPGDEVVIYKLDRLGRTLGGILDTVEKLRDLEVEFKSLNDPIDTSTALGRAFFQLMGVFAELEKSLIVERTAGGLMLAREKGVTFGRKRLLNEDALKMARVMLEGGQEVQKVAATLRVSPKTLRRRLDEQERLAALKAV